MFEESNRDLCRRARNLLSVNTNTASAGYVVVSRRVPKPTFCDALERGTDHPPVRYRAAAPSVGSVGSTPSHCATKIANRGEAAIQTS